MLSFSPEKIAHVISTSQYWLMPNIEKVEPLAVREFGINKCVVAARELFPPEVIYNWLDCSIEERLKLAEKYSYEVAKAFELKNYKGLYIEDTGFGVAGFNNGDGKIHISEILVNNKNETPFEIIDTIVHEMRHQYQSECMSGLHLIDKVTLEEWLAAEQMYTNERPYALDPWGYKYNALELDARYAGETVIREFTKDYRA